LSFKVKFEGIEENKGDREVKITLKQGGSLVDVFENVGVSGDRYGVYSATLMNLDPGTYDVFIKGWVHLQKKFTDVILNKGDNHQDWSDTELLTGDADNNNQINIQDLGVLARDYRESSSPADFNLDGIVNIQDFRYIAINYRKTGEE
jgi:hypothetical protein